MHHSMGAMGTGAPCIFNEWQPSVRPAFESDSTGVQSYVYTKFFRHKDCLDEIFRLYRLSCSMVPSALIWLAPMPMP